MIYHLRHILTKLPLFVRVAVLYIAIGIPFGIGFLHAPPSAPVYAQPPKPVVKQVAPPVPQIISGEPVQFSLPRIGLNLTVAPGTFDAQSQAWTLSEDKAHYATMTQPLSTAAGTTVIYGHNTVAVLEPVVNLTVGDELRATASNGRVFVYTYSSDRFVVPTDVSVFTESSATPRLVLMTCEGWLSQTRRLMYFDFKEVL